MTPAKRGDLVVVHTVMTSYALHGPRTETDHFDAGEVTSITREGIVKRWRRCDDLAETDHLGRPDKGNTLPTVGYRQHVIVSATVLDVTGALATAATHVWDTGREHTMPYATLDEVREALRPHLRKSGTWEALHTAALAWQTARRQADTTYHDAGTAANRAEAEAGYHTREGNQLRHRLDREAMDAHTAAQAEANRAYRAAYAAATEAASAVA